MGNSGASKLGNINNIYYVILIIYVMFLKCFILMFWFWITIIKIIEIKNINLSAAIKRCHEIQFPSGLNLLLGFVACGSSAVWAVYSTDFIHFV